MSSIMTKPEATVIDGTEFMLGMQAGKAKRFRASLLKGIKGDPGASAYQLAVAAGFSGTLPEWIASLGGEAATPTPVNLPVFKAMLAFYVNADDTEITIVKQYNIASITLHSPSVYNVIFATPIVLNNDDYYFTSANESEHNVNVERIDGTSVLLSVWDSDGNPAIWTGMLSFWAAA